MLKHSNICLIRRSHEIPTPYDVPRGPSSVHATRRSSHRLGLSSCATAPHPSLREFRLLPAVRIRLGGLGDRGPRQPGSRRWRRARRIWPQKCGVSKALQTFFMTGRAGVPSNWMFFLFEVPSILFFLRSLNPWSLSTFQDIQDIESPLKMLEEII